MRFTQKEYLKVKRIADKREWGNMTSVCREIIMDVIKRRRWLRPDELQATTNAFSRVGVNLNQIAKVLNSEKQSSPELREQISQEIMELVHLRVKLISGKINPSS